MKREDMKHEDMSDNRSFMFSCLHVSCLHRPHLRHHPIHHLILRRNGELGLYLHKDGVPDGVLLAPSVRTRAPAIGKWAHLRVEVSPDRIVASRTDVGGATVTTRFAVNAASSEQSAIAPLTRLALSGTTGPGRSGLTAEFSEWWPWLALGALVILSVEWLVFHRGI